jgi:hypothetical protein
MTPNQPQTSHPGRIFGRCRSTNPTATLSRVEAEPAASATHECKGERP